MNATPCKIGFGDDLKDTTCNATTVCLSAQVKDMVTNKTMNSGKCINAEHCNENKKKLKMLAKRTNTSLYRVSTI